MTSEPIQDFHFFVGDANDGTVYDHTVNGLTLDEAVRHALRSFVAKRFRNRMEEVFGDSTSFTLSYCAPEADFCELVIHVYSREGDVRSPETSGRAERLRELSNVERGRLKH